MRKSSLLMSLTAAIAALIAAPSAGHHSSAMFDDQSELTLTGVVTRFDYLNPHSWLYMNVTQDDGTVTEWGFELSAPPLLRREGVSPNSWRPGDLVRVRTHPLKDGRPAGSLRGIVKSDGSRYRNAEGLEPPSTQ